MKQKIALSLLSAVCLLLALVKFAIAEETNSPSDYNDRAFTLGQDDKLKQVISSLSRQIQSEPTNTTAIHNLALAYRFEGDFDKSLALWNDYIRLNPTNDMAFKYRATVYNALGKYDEAIKDFTEALRLNPKDAYALANRGFAYSQNGEYDKAFKDFTDGVRLDANNDEACNNLAWLRATCPIASMRDGKAAELMAMKACDLTRWTRIDTLAAAYAEAGDFTNAVNYEKKAIEMDGISKDDSSGLQQRLSLYEEHKPYREGLDH